MTPIPEGRHALALALQYRLQQTQSLKPEAANALLAQSLQQLLKHAIETVPYYRMQPEIRRMGGKIRWDEVPTLDRRTLQACKAQLRSERPPESHGKTVEFRSSGSTGRPVHTFSSEYAQWYWRAMTVRSHLWARRDLSKKLAVIKFFPTGESMYPGVTAPVWGPSAAALGYQGPLAVLNSSESIAQQYHWLQEHQPDYLLTYPSTLQALAQLQLQERRLNGLQGLSTLGETLSDSTRAIAADAFGCQVYDSYSAQEVGYIALQCPQHDHYHIQLENCLVEVLDEDKQPCPPGRLGRVAVTSLQNYVMPLIRYEIGDYAVLGEPCDCGITLPTLERVAGRTRNLLTYPDGRKTWPAYNPMALMALFPKARFQLEQTRLDALVLRVQTDAAINRETEHAAIRIVQAAMQHPFKITVERTDDLPRSKGGKYEEFKSRL